MPIMGMAMVQTHSQSTHHRSGVQGHASAAAIVPIQHPQNPNHGHAHGSKQKRKEKKDKHRKCRLYGIPFCQERFSHFERMRTKIIFAVRAMCSVQSEPLLPLLQNQKGKPKDSEMKQKLLSGLWCFAFGGKVTQSQLGPDVASAPSEQKAHKVHFFHVSYVWGGLQQFNPTVMVCKLKASSGNDEADIEWPLPPTVFFVPTIEILSFHEWLAKLDVHMQWTLQIYELSTAAKPIAHFCFSKMEACKQVKLPEYVVWHGPADCKKQKKKHHALDLFSEEKVKVILCCT